MNIIVTMWSMICLLLLAKFWYINAQYYIESNYRKRRSSPSQMKPPGRKRRQVKIKPSEATMEAGEEYEESDSEEESPPHPDSTPTHTRYNYVFFIQGPRFPFSKTNATCSAYIVTQ